MPKKVIKFWKQRMMHLNMMKLRTYFITTLPMITLRLMMRNFQERKLGDFKLMRIKLMRIRIIFLIRINLMRINANNENSHYFTNNCLLYLLVQQISQILARAAQTTLLLSYSPRYFMELLQVLLRGFQQTSVTMPS